jgi:hypothetical protein
VDIAIAAVPPLKWWTNWTARSNPTYREQCTENQLCDEASLIVALTLHHSGHHRKVLVTDPPRGGGHDEWWDRICAYPHHRDHFQIGNEARWLTHQDGWR